MAIFGKWFKRNAPTKSRKRAFKAAGMNRLTAGWITAPTTADYDIKAGLTVLRARSRELYQNNEYAKQFVRLAQTNVIGPNGIQLQSRVRDARGEIDQAATDAIETAFKRWGQRGKADATGRKSWWGIQRDLIQQVAVDGEFLALEVNGRPHGYRLRILDPERLPIDLDKDLGGGAVIRSGIEYDAAGAPVAYWIRKANKSPHQSAYIGGGTQDFERFPASRVIHEFIPEFAIQGRGVPLFATALFRLGMLDGYQEAELIASRVAAAAVGFFEQGADSEGEYTGDQPDPDNEGDFEIEAEPGVFRTLPQGLKLAAWTPNRPTSVYDAFVRNCLQQFASGLGVSYAALSNDYSGANYSSLRQALLVERDVWACFQTWAAESLHDRVFENWLTAALDFGKIKVKGQEPRRGIDEYLAHDWQPRRWAWVDPQKELAAIEKALQLGVRSEMEIIREMGRDPDAVIAERAAWRDKLKKAGLTPADTAPAIGAANQQNEDGTNVDEDENPDD